jgi:RNA polymerase sigma-70 factor (ECF subfamily)
LVDRTPMTCFSLAGTLLEKKHPIGKIRLGEACIMGASSKAAADQAGEAALITLARQSDTGAIRTIMSRYNRRLYRIARSILRDDGEAEDAVQEAYLRAFGALATFRHESTLGTWLTRIVLNEALGRRRGRGPPLEQVTGAMLDDPGARIIAFPHSPQTDPERSLAQRQIRQTLERAIDELPANFRTVLVARVIEEMSVEETAELLGLRTETVKTRLHRARRLLKLAIEKQIGPVLMDAFPFAGRRCERMTEEVLRRLSLDSSTSGNL